MLFANTDIDGDGYVTLNEWVVTFIDKNELISEKKLEIVFNLFDQGGDKSISAKELRTELSLFFDDNLSDSEWKEIINEVDKDGNGQVEFDEFKQMMRKCMADEKKVEN